MCMCVRVCRGAGHALDLAGGGVRVALARAAAAHVARRARRVRVRRPARAAAALIPAPARAPRARREGRRQGVLLHAPPPVHLPQQQLHPAALHRRPLKLALYMRETTDSRNRCYRRGYLPGKLVSSIIRVR